MIHATDGMNETDVREIIVRPLLNRLGYEFGTKANIRTEVALRYARAFLGRKDATRDPPLSGRADYVCEAISFGRWVVEVKSPRLNLSQDDVEQAHTYCAHPEIGAIYFLLTNGREFRIYITGNLSEPVLAWSLDDTDRQYTTIANILSYEAIRRKYSQIAPDIQKPLCIGFPSTVRIIGGKIEYGEHSSDSPFLSLDPLIGKIATVTGKSVVRGMDGRLCATVSLISPFPQLAAINKELGIDDYIFYSSDEYVSTDVARPTIFQNILAVSVPSGMKVEIFPGIPEVTVPSFRCTVFTEATGFVDGKWFKGVATFDYVYEDLHVPALNSALLGKMNLKGVGTFEIELLN